MTWFETLTGFPEESPQQVRKNITLEGNVLKSHVNGKVLVYGEMETPSLAELRQLVRSANYRSGGQEKGVRNHFLRFNSFTPFQPLNRS